MSFYSILSSYIDWSSFKFGFHNSKVFFYFPTLFVNPYDFRDITFQICNNSIKTIIHFFFLNLFFIDIVYLFISDFSIWRHRSLLYKTHWIILIFSFSFTPRCVDDLFSMFDLAVTNSSLVCFIFWRISNNQSFIHVSCNHGNFFVINSVINFFISFIKCTQIYEFCATDFTKETA